MRRPQNEAIEVVGDVVVMADRRAVACQRMSPAADRGLDRGDRRPAQDHGPGERATAASASRIRSRTEKLTLVELARVWQDVVEVTLDGKRAVDPGAREPELARLMEQVRERPPVLGHHDRHVVAARGARAGCHPRSGRRPAAPPAVRRRARRAPVWPTGPRCRCAAGARRLSSSARRGLVASHDARS